MGLTQHAHGVDTIKALVNVGLARGLPGREGCGLVPIRGHSGVQGGAEVGCVPTVDAATAARWAQVWGFPVPATAGWTAAEMVEHAADGDVDVLWMVGGNFLATLPDAARSQRALQRPHLRVHQDIVVSSSMLADCDGDVVLLPSATRYESPGGGTETTTERRIVFSPEIAGRRIGSARPEWQVFGDVAARVRPDRKARFVSSREIRHEIARTVPLYAGIERLDRQGDQVQWGGPRLFTESFATPDGKAHFSAVVPPERSVPEGSFYVSTRRGKQFNSMVQREVDPLTGASREDVLISREDAERLGVHEGDRIRLRSPCGTYEGRVRIDAIKPRNLEVHWPEGNVLPSG